MEASKEANNQKIVLAIVIPYFKIAFFEKTLSSLANQTCKKFRVYIGDDASPENPTRLIAQYEPILELTYKRFSENIGNQSLVSQWDRCISMTAEEQWILILGDDDFLGNRVVEGFYKNYPLFHKKTNVVRFASQTIDENTSELSSVFKHPTWEKAEESQYKRMLGFTRSTLSEYVFKKEIYLSKGFRDLPLAWHSDDLAWLDLSDHKPIFTINEGVVYVRISDLNISGKKDNLEQKDQATLEFYQNLIDEKSNLYRKDQMGVILKRYEDLKVRRNEVNKEAWQFLFSNYLQKTTFRILMRFLKRSIERNLKRG